jgi:subtilisin family serine protease
MKKFLSLLVTACILFSTVSPVVTLADTSDSALEKLIDQSEVVLDKMEAVADGAIEKLDARISDPVIEAQLEIKAEEIQEYLAEVSETLQDVESKTELKEVLEEAKKVVTLKVVSGSTDYDNVLSEATASIEWTKAQKADAAEVIMENLVDDTEDTYTLMVKTSYTYDKALSILKPYDDTIALFELFTEDGLNYFEATISSKSLLSEEILPNLEQGILPDTLLGIDIIKPEALKIWDITPAPTPTSLTGEDTTLWGINYFGLVPYYDVFTKTPVRVAIVDTGIVYSHPDLAWRIDTQTAYDFVNDDNDASDDQGHGTHVAGTIAAAINWSGITGVYPHAQIVPLKICDASGFCPTYAVFKAVSYAIDKNIAVINMSLGGTGNPATSTVCQAIDAATKSGIIVVSAAGNANRDVKTFVPGGCSSAISVAAIDKNSARASFSNYGAGVDISAPGVGIYSTYLNNGYKTLDGTSMASPHIAGLVALMLAHKPGLTTDGILSLFSQFSRSTTSDLTKRIAPSVEVGAMLDSLITKTIAIETPPPVVVEKPILEYVVDYSTLEIDPTDGTLIDTGMTIQLLPEGSSDIEIANFNTTTYLTMILWEPMVSIKANTDKLLTKGYEVIPNDTGVATAFYDNPRKAFTINPRGLGKTTIKILEFQTRKFAGEFVITVTAPKVNNVSISPNSITIDPNNIVNTNIATASGGSGSFIIEGLADNAIATAHVANSNISVRGKSPGTASFKICDTKNLSNCSFLQVKVAYPATHISVSPGSVVISPDNTVNVVATVSGGTGNYAISGGDGGIATGNVSGKQVSVRGIGVGNTSFTLRDTGNNTTVVLGVIVNSLPRSLTLNRNSLTLLPWTSDTVQINSGNGDYKVKSSNTSVAKATISGVAITVQALSLGTSMLTVTDAKGNEVNIQITVWTPEKELVTTFTTTSIVEGTSVTASISSGNGEYTAVSSNPEIATATLNNRDIVITGVKPGQTLIVVRDIKKKYVHIKVTVTKLIHPIILDKNQVSLNPGASTKVNILQGNGEYTVQSMYPQYLDASIVWNEITLKALQYGPGQILVRDREWSRIYLDVRIEKLEMGTPMIVRWTPDQTTIIYSMWSYKTFKETWLEYVWSDGKLCRIPAQVSTAKNGASYTYTIKNLESRVQPYYIDLSGRYMTISPGDPQIQTYSTPIQTASADEEIVDEEEILFDETPLEHTLTDEEGNPLVLPVLTSTEESTEEVWEVVPTPETEQAQDSIQINAVAIAPTIQHHPAISTSPYLSILLPKWVKTTLDTFSGMQLTLNSGTSNTQPLISSTATPYFQWQGNTVGRYTYNAYSDRERRNGIASLVVDVYNPLVFTSSYVNILPNNQVNMNVLSVSGGLDTRYKIRGGHASIATGTINGNQVSIRGIGEGVTKFFIYSEANTALEKSFTVRVGNQKSLSLTKTSLTLVPGTSQELSITGNGGYTISSSDSQVASASIRDDAVLVVTAGKPGSTTLILRDSLGKSLSLPVTVTGSSVITLDSSTLSVPENETKQVTITAGNGGYSVETSQSRIATASIVGNTVVITPKALWTTIITVRDILGKSALLSVTVTAGIKKIQVGPTTLSLNGSNVAEVQIFSWNGGYTLTSSDPTVAIAYLNGSNKFHVKSLTGGNTTITVTDSQGQKAAVEVEVNWGVRPLTLDRAAYNLTLNTSIQVKILNGNGGYIAHTPDYWPLVSTTIKDSILTINGVKTWGTTLIVRDQGGQTATMSIAVTSEISPTSITNIRTANWWEDDMSIYFDISWWTFGGYKEVGLEYRDDDGNLYRHMITKKSTNSYNIYIKDFGRKVQPYFIDMNGVFYSPNPGAPNIQTPVPTSSIQTASDEGEEEYDPALEQYFDVEYETPLPMEFQEQNEVILEGNIKEAPEVTVDSNLLDVSGNEESGGEEWVEINSAPNVYKPRNEFADIIILNKYIEVGKTLSVSVIPWARIVYMWNEKDGNKPTLTKKSDLEYTITSKIAGNVVYNVYFNDVILNQIVITNYKPLTLSKNEIRLTEVDRWDNRHLEYSLINWGTGSFKISYSNANIRKPGTINGNGIIFTYSTRGETFITVTDNLLSKWGLPPAVESQLRKTVKVVVLPKENPTIQNFEVTPQVEFGYLGWAYFSVPTNTLDKVIEAGYESYIHMGEECLLAPPSGIKTKRNPIASEGDGEFASLVTIPLLNCTVFVRPYVIYTTDNTTQTIYDKWLPISYDLTSITSDGIEVNNVTEEEWIMSHEDHAWDISSLSWDNENLEIAIIPLWWIVVWVVAVAWWIDTVYTCYTTEFINLECGADVGLNFIPFGKVAKWWSKATKKVAVLWFKNKDAIISVAVSAGKRAEDLYKPATTLLRASQVLKKPLKSIDLEHILERHTHGTIAQASKFIQWTDIEWLIQEWYRKSGKRFVQTSSLDRFTGKTIPSIRMEVDLWRQIGTDKNYDGDFRILRMITDHNNRILSAYPIKNFQIP